MCVAGLNVSTQPCAHRWYVLHRSCADSTNLSNCSARLQLEGWEIRNATCPWCESDTTLHGSTHRLFGNNNTAASNSTILTPIPSASEAARTRSHRSGSDGTLESLSRVSSLSSVMSTSPVEHSERLTRSQIRDRGMNERLDLYLSLHPHEVLPSARKNYPTYSNCSSAANTAPSSSAEDSAAVEFPLMRRTSSGLSKKWRKSVRLSRDFFRS